MLAMVMVIGGGAGVGTARTPDAGAWTGPHVGDGWEETEDSGWAPGTLGHGQRS